MRWILDDGLLDILASLPDHSNLVSYPAGELCVAAATARDAGQSEPRIRLLSMVAADGRSIFSTFELLSDDDPAGAVLLRLRPEEQTDADLAECEAIAWAAVHAEDTVFVTQDKKAAYIALAVLGRSRVAHTFDLWIELLEQGAITAAGFEHLCEQTRRKEKDAAALRWLPDRVTRLFASQAGGDR